MLIVSLIEEHVFSVITLSCVLLEDSFSANSVLLAELLPEFVSNCESSKVRLFAKVTYSDCHIGQLEA